MTQIRTKRVIYYYQTFTGLQPILYSGTPVTDIHLSSVHFGINPDKSKYIHLNNYPPDNLRFNQVWKDLDEAVKLGINIKIMIGGSGGAFTNLFSDYETFYPMLKKILIEHSVISGVDLDVEEMVPLKNIKKLINQISNDFPKFTFAMAPVQSSIENDVSGMGGFLYKDLYNSPEGKKIEYFNGQFYGSYQASDYHKVINNGYPPEKIVMGLTSGQYDQSVPETIKSLVEKYPTFGGVYVWEYYSTNKKWAQEMHQAMNVDSNILELENPKVDWVNYFYKYLPWIISK